MHPVFVASSGNIATNKTLIAQDDQNKQVTSCTFRAMCKLQNQMSAFGENSVEVWACWHTTDADTHMWCIYAVVNNWQTMYWNTDLLFIPSEPSYSWTINVVKADIVKQPRGCVGPYAIHNSMTLCFHPTTHCFYRYWYQVLTVLTDML